MSFSVDAASAPMLQELTSGCGALVAGRRLFDQTDGWGDNHPAGAPVVVVTHRPPPEDAGGAVPADDLHRQRRGGDRDGEGDRRRQVRHDRQRRHHPAGAQPRPRRRALHQPGAGAVRHRHPLLRRAHRRPRHARGPRRGARHPGAPPPLPRATLTTTPPATQAASSVARGCSELPPVRPCRSRRCRRVATHGSHRCGCYRRSLCVPASAR